jgi:hypothetical protein
VIGGLVQNGDIGAGDEQLREGDAPSLSAAARPARPVDVTNSQTVEKAQGLMPAFPSAEPCDAVVQLRLFREEQTQRGAIRLGADPRANLGVPQGGRPPSGQSVFHHRPRARLSVQLRFLREVADGEPSADAERARIGNLQASENARERRLASSVGTDKTYLLASSQVESGVFEDDLRAKGFSKVLTRQGGHVQAVAPIA